MVLEAIEPKPSDNLRIHTATVNLVGGDKYQIHEVCDIEWVAGHFSTVSHAGNPLPAESGKYLDGAVIVAWPDGCSVRVRRYIRTPQH